MNKKQQIKIKNLTPHKVVLDGITYPSEGNFRLGVETKSINGEFPFPISISNFYSESKMPPVEFGTIYIVSKMVAEFFPERKDFWIINESYRNPEGTIIGCKSLTHIKMNEDEIKKYFEKINHFFNYSQEQWRNIREVIDKSPIITYVDSSFFYSQRTMYDIPNDDRSIINKGIVIESFNKNKSNHITFVDRYNPQKFVSFEKFK